MLFLLRNIRRKMLSGNKITTYLLYAIGEIFLVVIGILIAVSIDDWNNDRLQTIAERNYLTNLKKDLQDDIKSLVQMETLATNKVNAANRFRSRINHDTVGALVNTIRDLETLVFVGEFAAHQNTYQEMTSTGSFSNLKNKDIKLDILNLYDTYAEIQSGQFHIRNDYEVFLEDLQKHIDLGAYYNLPASDFEKLKLVLDSENLEHPQNQIKEDFDHLLTENVFRNNVFLIEVNYRYFVPIYTKTRLQVEKLIALIDTEMNKN